MKTRQQLKQSTRFIMICLFLVLVGIFCLNSHRAQQIFPYAIEDKQVTLTSQEALELAYQEAAKVMDEPMLIRLQSTDDTEELQTINSGVDGKRIAWNVSFGNRQGTSVTDCQIRNGKCNVVFHDENKEGRLAKGDCLISDLRIDSSEVIEKAIQEKNLQPGDPAIEDDWIKGYHFTIYMAPFDQDTNSTSMVLRVTGISPDSPNKYGASLRAEVYFDAQTGEILGAAKQTGYDENGRSTWEDF